MRDDSQPGGNRRCSQTRPHWASDLWGGRSEVQGALPRPPPRANKRQASLARHPQAEGARYREAHRLAMTQAVQTERRRGGTSRIVLMRRGENDQ